MRKIRESKREFENEQLTFQTNIRKSIVSIRKGHLPEDDLEDLVCQFEQNTCSSDKLYELLDSYTSLRDRIDFIKNCNIRNINYIPKKEIVAKYLGKNNINSCYVLYLTKDKDYDSLYKVELKILWLLIHDTTNSETKFYICDLEISPQKDVKKNRITKYANNQISVLDINENNENILLKSHIKMENIEPIKENISDIFSKCHVLVVFTMETATITK